MGAGRPYSWARYWTRDGHDVTVLTTPKTGSGTNLDLPPPPCPVWEAPLGGVEWLRRLYHRARRDPTVAAGAGPAEPGATGRAPRLARAIRAVRSRLDVVHTSRMPTLADLWIRPALELVRGRARHGRRWDAVVSTSSPYAAHVIADRIVREGLAARWIADFRDLWTENPAIDGIFPFVRVERALEDRLMRRASGITVVSETDRALMAARHEPTPVVVIPNGFDPEDHRSLSPAPAFPDDEHDVYRIVYTGSIYRNQSAEPLFAAVAELDRRGCAAARRIRILFAGPRLGTVETDARRHGVDDRVVLHGLVPRTVAYRMQRDADALLFLDWRDPSVRGIPTGKIYEYLFASPPVLAVGGSRDSAAAELVRRARAGFVFGEDATALADHLGTVLRGQGPSLPGRDPDVLQSFTRESLARRLLALLTGETPAGG